MFTAAARRRFNTVRSEPGLGVRSAPRLPRAQRTRKLTAITAVMSFSTVVVS